MEPPTMTRGVAVWVMLSGLFSLFVGCSTCVELAGKGEIGSALVALAFIPIIFWFLATVGAGAINVFTVSGQVLNAQVSESKEIQGDD